MITLCDDEKREIVNHTLRIRASVSLIYKNKKFIPSHIHLVAHELSDDSSSIEYLSSTDISLEGICDHYTILSFPTKEEAFLFILTYTGAYVNIVDHC